MPCPFTGPKLFCAGPNFLCQTKNLFIYCGNHQMLCQTKRWFAFSKIGFCADTKYFGTCKRTRHYCPPSIVLSSWKSPPLSAFHSLTSLGIKCHTSLASNIFACTHSMHWIKLNCNYFLAWVCESSKSVFSSTAWIFIPNGYLDAYEVKVNLCRYF